MAAYPDEICLAESRKILKQVSNWGDKIVTQKEIYCMGRTEYLAEYEGYSLTEGYQVVEAEWDDMNE